MFVGLICLLLSCISFLLRPPIIVAADYYVSSTAGAAGTGTFSNPWTLQTAFNHPSTVKPGDTIWLRGGIYNGSYDLKIRGTAAGRIVVRNYQNERVTLSNNTPTPVIEVINAAYVDLWGLEITDPNTARAPRPLTSTEKGSYGILINKTETLPSNNLRYINLIVHDRLAQGYGWWANDTNSQIYGNLIYYNGNDELQHGIYTDNESGTKTLKDSFIFHNAGYGFHAYSETVGHYLNNYTIEGNTFFGNSSIGWDTGTSYGTRKANLLIGSTQHIAQNPVITQNYLYQVSSSNGILNLGYSDGTNNGTVTGNTFMGGWLAFRGTQSGLNFSNNRIFAHSLDGLSQISGNTWLSGYPTSGLEVYVRRNVFEPNRSHVTIFNWSQASSITLTQAQLASSGIVAGNTYEFRNVADYYNQNNYVSGTYNGSSISLPMTASSYSVAQPEGLNFKPSSTLPRFGAFVLLINSSAPPPSPTPSFPPTLTDPDADGNTDWMDHYLIDKQFGLPYLGKIIDIFALNALSSIMTP